MNYDLWTSRPFDGCFTHCSLYVQFVEVGQLHLYREFIERLKNHNIEQAK